MVFRHGLHSFNIKRSYILAKEAGGSEQEVELRILRVTRWVEGVVQVLLSLIRWVAIVLIARYGYLSIASLAGQNTLADIGINLLSNIKVSVALAGAAGVGGLIYGERQRKLRKNTVERLQGRIRELETEIDPNRSSSNLTHRGDTRPEDTI